MSFSLDRPSPVRVNRHSKPWPGCQYRGRPFDLLDNLTLIATIALPVLTLVMILARAK